MSKSVLVLCSSPKGSDYPSKDNQDMLDSLLKGVKPTIDFLSGEEGEKFPENVPKDKKYDAILFAGCNALIFISLLLDHKPSIDLLESILKKNGLVVIVESDTFVKKHVSGKHYDTHKRTLKLETLLKSHKTPGIQDKKEEYEATIHYWNTKFNAQQTKNDKYIVYTKKGGNAAAAAAAAAAPTAKEDTCQKILEDVKAVFSTGGAPTKQMEAIRDILVKKHIKATIGRKGTVKKANTNTRNINALGGEEACRGALRAIKVALQDTGHTADERVQEIRRQVGLEVRPNKTAKVSINSNSARTPEADFFDLFDANDPSSRDLATLNEVFKLNLLEHDAVYDKEAVETAAILKNGAEKTTFSVDQGKAIKEDIIRAQVLKDIAEKPEAEKEAAVQAKIAEEAAQSLQDFGALYQNFEGNCADVKISLECMHASGSNSDCFFHSFLGAACEFYRMAKVTGKPYNPFVTRFRKEIVPSIIEFVYKQEDMPAVTMAAEELIEELNSPGQFLPDDLYTIIAYYYNCGILLIRPKAADGIRVAPLIGRNTGTTYGISNSAGVHFEPLRIVDQNIYRLTDTQAKCLAYTYSQLSGTTATVDVKQFKEMGKVVPINKPGANGAIAYDEAAMLDKLSEGGKIRESDEPGVVTRAYMGIKGEGYDEMKTAQVRKLQELIGKLTQNYKDRQMFANAKLAPKSQDLEDSIQLLQQGIVDGTKGEADIAAKEADVAEFIERPTQAQAQAAAKAAKKSAKKKGGRRTLRKERRGRNTPRA